MDTKELNEYIQNYLKNDKTQRAIMLTAPWGSGKSFYIKNILCPFLHKNKKKYAVVSLYGIKDLKELNKSLYIELKANIFSKQTENQRKANIVGRTIIKGITSFFGIDVSQSEEQWQKLYKSINLKNSLIIFEDIERSGIDIVEFLGYVNNITENDNAKVLLVANEKEILKISYQKDKMFNQEVPVYTQESEKYLKIKEKTVCDTINFHSDYDFSIKGIIDKFDNKYFKQLLKEKDPSGQISLIRRIKREMAEFGCMNFRAILYACQRTEDFLSKLGESELDLKFVENLLIGTINYSIRIHRGERKEWKDASFTSYDLGSYAYPLHKIMYDFINFQTFKLQDIKYVEQVFLKGRNIAEVDEILKIIYNYYVNSEKDVKEALCKIQKQLEDDSGIVHNEYLRIANYLIALKYNLELKQEVDKCLKLMLANVEKAVGNGEEVQVYYSQGIKLIREEGILEFNNFKEKMLNIVESRKKYLGFDYSPEGLKEYHTGLIASKRDFINEGGFANKLDVKNTVEMLSKCLPHEIEEFRGILQYIYMGISNIADFLGCDIENLKFIKDGIVKLIKENKSLDKVQVLQLNWLIDNIGQIINKLEGGKNGI